MSTLIFTYNQEQAKAGGQGGFIHESGAYIFTIAEAKYVTTPSGAKSIEFTLETDDGRKANYVNVWHAKKEGMENPFGVNLIQAIMGCTGVRQLTSRMKDVNTYIAPELIGKRLGLVLQKILKTKENGQETYSLDIRIPFLAETRQTLTERLEGESAKTIDNIVASLKDKDERKKSASPYPATQAHAVDMNDIIPF